MSTRDIAPQFHSGTAVMKDKDGKPVQIPLLNDVTGRRVLHDLRGYEVDADTGERLIGGLVLRRHNVVLIFRDGHFIGARPFIGGLCLKFEGKDYPYQQFSMVVVEDWSLHTSIVIEGGSDLVNSSEVPFPFDRFVVGRQVLPPPGACGDSA